MNGDRDGQTRVMDASAATSGEINDKVDREKFLADV